MRRLLPILTLLFAFQAQGAITLVGTIGAASQGAASASVTPAWGAGESRTTGNLLICFISVAGSASSIGTVSGWNQANVMSFTSCSAWIYYKIATGSDAAPTIGPVTSGVIAVQLAEFSGNSAAPFDKTGTGSGTSSPVTATFGSADTASGELITMCGADFRSAARTPNDTWTSNNATITQAGNNNGASSANHYSFGYALATTSNSSANTAVMTCSVSTSITGLAVVAATFKPTPPVGPTAQQKASFMQFFP
jgi:hypothetical protein